MTPSIPDLMRDTRKVADRLNRTLTTMAGRLEQIEDDAWNPLRAQHYDPSSSSSPRLWCLLHDQALGACEASDHENCTVGEAESVGTIHSDPTFSAAEATNGARAKLGQVKRAVENLDRATRRLDDLLAPTALAPDAWKHIKEADRANTNAGCELCERHGVEAAPRTKEPTRVEVNGDPVLPRGYLLCTAHYEFVRTRFRLPTEEETAWHIKRGHGWPPSRMEQTDRFLAGIKQGRL